MNTLEHATGERTAGPELLTIREVSVLLGCSMRTIGRLADSGRMPHGLKLGGLRRWRRSEVLAWLNDGCPPVRITKGGPRDE